MTYDEYRELASRTFYGGRIRKTPWWLRLRAWYYGEPIGQYRMWFAPGPLDGRKPDSIWRGGYWKYF